MNLSIRRRSALPLLGGLAVAQLIATLFVRRSNLDLQQSVSAMQNAGWLSLPAGPAAQNLDSLAAAAWGGLSYTLSVGVGLALATWSLLYLWRRLFAGRPRLLWGPAAMWIALMVAVNLRGWVLFPTLFVVCVPLGTLLCALQKEDPGWPAVRSRLWPMPVITLGLLAALWATQLNEQLFTTIRDHLLLSNSAGQAVNDFYYRYTLHAAHAFKSFGQKTLRTCRLTPAAQADAPARLSAALADHDVVVAPDDLHPDVLIDLIDGQFELTSSAGDRIRIERGAFMADAGVWLRRFSEAGDRYDPLRRLTFAGLLIGFPTLLFVLVDGVVGRLTGLWVSGSALVWWRSGVCLALGVLLLIPMFGRSEDIPRNMVAKALTSERWTERVAALRSIEREKMAIDAFPRYRVLLQSPLVVERYYLARALAFSRTPATLNDLLTLIGDAHPNVVCQAYYALGRRGNPVAVTPIKTRMVQSDHWYTQWYGYRAIRSLGWRQRQ